MKQIRTHLLYGDSGGHFSIKSVFWLNVSAPTACKSVQPSLLRQTGRLKNFKTA
ncbi:hypothetical protein l13_15010 [Neisseria weaveri ATCC 51223]|nr:hypothetical protein l13_15010 [Neisseria weaveri ATCC 51223]